jgi:hypothetical protein
MLRAISVMSAIKSAAGFLSSAILRFLYQLLVTLHRVSTRQGGEYLRNLAVLSTISENNWAAKCLRNEQS